MTKCSPISRTVMRSGRGTAAGPMGEAVDQSFSQMALADIHALAQLCA